MYFTSGHSALSSDSQSPLLKEVTKFLPDYFFVRLSFSIYVTKEIFLEYVLIAVKSSHLLGVLSPILNMWVI